MLFTKLPLPTTEYINPPRSNSSYALFVVITLICNSFAKPHRWQCISWFQFSTYNHIFYLCCDLFVYRFIAIVAYYYLHFFTPLMYILYISYIYNIYSHVHFVKLIYAKKISKDYNLLEDCCYDVY